MAWLPWAGGALPRLARSRLPLHARHQLPPVAADVGPRRGLPLHAAVDLPGGAAPRQPRHIFTDGPRSTRRCSRRSAARRGRSTWSATSSSPGGSPTSSSTRSRSARATGVNVTIVVDAIGSFDLWGRPVARLRAAGCRIESYQRAALVLAAPHQQPHAPRAARRRRRDRVRRRRRRRRLVGVSARGKRAAVARHDGARRGPGRRGAAGRRGRELAGVLRRDPDRARLLSRPRRRAATRRRSSIKSSPSDRATASRVTFQLLIEGADHDRPHQHAVFPAGPRAAARARERWPARRRGHASSCPGGSTDQHWVRLASRRMWGELLRRASGSSSTSRR